MQLSIVLVEPQNPGNIGAVARCMANFDFKELILIKPKCKINEETRRRAKHAQQILKDAQIKDWHYLKRFDYLIGTAGKATTDYNLPRTPLTPSTLAERIVRLKKTCIALLFGREGDGLLNEELQQCDFLVTIPVSAKYPSLNISHALGIILYEIFQKTSKDKITDVYIPVDAKDKGQLIKRAYEALDRMEFFTENKRQTQRTLWRRLIGKMFLTKREAYALMGFFRRIKN